MAVLITNIAEKARIIP